MKKPFKVVLISVSVICLVFLALVIKNLFLPALYRVYRSPDRQYQLWVYTLPLPFAMPGQGGFGSRETLVILRNHWGWPLDKSSRYPDGAGLVDDIEVEWSENMAWYGRAQGFKLPRPLRISPEP